jgi:hypothetical protein
MSVVFLALFLGTAVQAQHFQPDVLAMAAVANATIGNCQQAVSPQSPESPTNRIR